MSFSTMFHPVLDLPAWLRVAAHLDPLTWQVDLLRFGRLGTGDPTALAIEEAAGEAARIRRRLQGLSQSRLAGRTGRPQATSAIDIDRARLRVARAKGNPGSPGPGSPSGDAQARRRTTSSTGYGLARAAHSLGRAYFKHCNTAGTCRLSSALRALA